MAFLNEDISINSILGVGSTIRGDIKINGFVRIDGDIDGNLETTGNVIIGENARMQGNITARSVTVGGIVKGNITASESVQLLSTSIVVGDILTHHIMADEKVIFHGHCIALSNEAEYNDAFTKWQNVQVITSHSILSAVHVSHDEQSFLEPKHTEDFVSQQEENPNNDKDAPVEEMVQDITINNSPEEKPADVDTTQQDEPPKPVEEADAPTDRFIPITLGTKLNLSAEPDHSQDNKTE
jgi:cytoskeletal protein CcmA (bactofilin family)